MVLQESKLGQVLIDEDDFERASEYHWAVYQCSTNLFYARATSKARKTVYLHRLVMDAPKGYEVDHINGNGLDNRRENLRVCTHRQNMGNMRININNTSGYRGVTAVPRQGGGWKAQIKHAEEGNRKRCICFGTYSTKEAAAYAYDLAAREHFGDYARLNLLRPGDDLAVVRRYVRKHQCGRAAGRLEACG